MSNDALRSKFETAWNSDGGKDGFPKYADGSYSWAPQRIAFDLYCMGHAAGMEDAAVVFEQKAYDESGYCIDPDAADIADQIRAKAKGEKP